MICPNCGSNNADGTRFCTGCGAILEGAVPPPPVQQPQPQYQPPQYQQPQYQQPPFQSAVPAQDPNAAPMKVGEFFWMMLVMSLPIAGFICMLIWAFGSNVNYNRKNLSRAYLVWLLVGIGISLIVAILTAVLGGSYIISDLISTNF